jgi:hypothetical protein
MKSGQQRDGTPCNNIPADDPGVAGVAPAPVQPVPDNTLSEKEKRDGWQLLFDGQTLNGWHKYGKETIGKAWVINDNAIHLEASPNADGGDIVTNETFGDYELQTGLENRCLWQLGYHI